MQSQSRKPSPWEVLGVTPFTPFAEVKRAFMQLAMEHHPDRTNGQSHDAFVQLKQALDWIQERQPQPPNQPQQNQHNQQQPPSSSNGKYRNVYVGVYPHADDEDAHHSWNTDNITHTYTSQRLHDHFVMGSLHMSEETRQEVIAAYRAMEAPTGRAASCQQYDKGGYWAMARALAEQDTLRIATPASLPAGPAMRRKKK
jgi:hypothetical protein